jgi:hypothetical protein
MTEPVEDRLRSVLRATALREVPDSLVIPPRRTGTGPARMRIRGLRPWLFPAVAALAAAVIALVTTVVVVRHSSTQHDAAPNPVVAGTVTTTPSGQVLIPPPVTALPGATALAGVPALPGVTGPLKVGVGPEVTVPRDLIGMSLDRASAELARLGLKTTRQAVDGTAPLDIVVGLSGVAAGRRTATGSTITLQVSNNALFVVPDLSNLTPAAAAGRLNAVGWKGDVASINQRISPTLDPRSYGRIASGPVLVVGRTGDPVQIPSQTPAAGRPANKAVGITVAVYGRKLITVPSFTPGVARLADIQNQIITVGFIDVTFAIVGPAVPPHVPHSFISITGASPGDQIPFDTPITITVWGDAPASGAPPSATR